MFAVKRPCDECPFRKTGGVRVKKDRAREIAGYFIEGSGGMFPCHKTTERHEQQDCPVCEGSGVNANDSGPLACTACDGDGVVKDWSTEWQVCAGGMLFADKLGKMSTMMQLGVRLGLMQLDELQDRDQVFDSLREMVNASDSR